jgi:hypothetical protein
MALLASAIQDNQSAEGKLQKYENEQWFRLQEIRSIGTGQRRIQSMPFRHWLDHPSWTVDPFIPAAIG